MTMRYDGKGPTKNASYNKVLLAWDLAGHDASPECEHCGKDLTGLDVIERAAGWLCVACAETRDEGPSDEWLRNEERKQMGMGS
jgi:hypothetical protein